MSGKNLFWLRAEVKPNEKRSPILPEHAKKLIEAGHSVTVEASETRCVSNEEYQNAGCTIVPPGTWKTLAPANAIILGLKELDVEDAEYSLVHRHVYFAHCYKNQSGWKELLTRFVKGNGTLLDMEFLTHANGARVAAFGRSAGFIGMATGILNWCFQQRQKASGQTDTAMPPLRYYQDFKELVAECSQQLKEFQEKPKVLIIGALGRCGRGAVSLAEQCGLEPTKWDINETQAGGPFKEALDFDVLVNCIYLAQPIRPFVTKELIQNPGRRLSCVVDVSCDFTNPYNPLPIYAQGTTFTEPTVRILQNPTLDVIAIDHLPSLVPLESSKEFADALIAHLVECDVSDVWTRVKQLFMDKTDIIRKEYKTQLQHIWVRDEVQETERRTALTPQDARKLIELGFTVTVERSTKRVFQDSEYITAGCTLVEAGSWKDAPSTATILGLQSFPNDDQFPLRHRHICFGYAFKQQAGWKELLTRFVEGGGQLLDIEYLVDGLGKRLATFAAIAGYVAMSAGILIWCHRQLNPNTTRTKRSHSKDNIQLELPADIDKEVPLLVYIKTQLEKAIKVAGQAPVPVIIGKGNVGTGAYNFAKTLGLRPAVWTRKDTKVATEHGIPKLLEFDILVNAIKLDSKINPFLTPELLALPDRELTVIVDVSCDVYNPNNPLPIYKATNSFTKPAQRIVDDLDNPLDLVAIQNLAALVPRESSINFSAQLVHQLLYIADANYPVWSRALDVFKTKTKGLKSSTTASVPIMQLPTDFPRPTGKEAEVFTVETQSASVSLEVSPSLSNSLATRAAALQVSSNEVVLAAFQVLCHRLSAEEDFMVGVLKSASNRFAKLLGVRSTMNHETSFEEILEKDRASVRSEEQVSYPFSVSELVSAVKSRPINFQVLFVDGVEVAEASLKETLALFDIVLVSSDKRLNLVYRKDLFIEVRAREILSQLSFLLTQIAASTESVKVGKASLVTESATQLPNPKEPLGTQWEGTVLEHFVRNAQRIPDKVAVVHNNTTLTYRELDELSAQLANWLVKQGLKVEDTVFIYGHRNLSMVWTIIAILRAGGAVSLMDPAYPSERIINCLKVAEPKCWLSIEAAGPVPADVLEFMPSVGTNIVLTIPLPQEAKERGFLKEMSTKFTETIPINQDTVGVVTFTSGSTGLPKAVQGRHGPLTHFYPWMKERFSLSENDHFSMCSGISHDPLQRDIFTPLYLGATIHVPDAADIGNPGQLARWMKAHGITVTHLTPAMGQLLSETVDDTQVTTLRVSLFVGDKLTKRDVYRLRKVAPQVLCVNMYGSTETQRSVSYYPVPPNNELESMKEILPVGQGMKDVQLIILNAQGIPCGVGELGEIYMRSAHLAKGYKGLIEQTREKFIVNPFREEPVDRLYRTGDLGRFKCDGMVEVVGRVDNQVKIRGFRIELGEINTMLSHHPSVKENVPIVREDSPGDKRIVAYVVPVAGKLLPPGHELRRFLENKLPNYMIPSAFVVLKALPLTPNGKINTGALPAPERMATNRLDRIEPQFSDTLSFSESSFKGLWKEMFPDMNLDDSPTASVFASPEQQKVAKIWAELLSTYDFGPNDSFFDLGGHSLMATRLIFMLKQVFGVDFPFDQLSKNPTVAGIAQTIVGIKSNPKFDQSSIDLNAECVLDSMIKLPASVFLTGATGFVGAFLLRELLDSVSGKVYCLVRESTGINAHQKLVQHLKIHQVWKDTYDGRIIPVLGDLSQLLFGLSEPSFVKLAESIDFIVHNGAVVHWLLPYEKLKAANVGGTTEVLRLASTSKVKPVHYVSTTSVFDAKFYSTKDMVLKEDDTLDHYPEAGGYGQSKWVTEKLAMSARRRGIPVSVYRPGYISGDESHGIWTTDDFLCRFIKGCIQLKAFPDMPDAKLDISTVDFVTKSLVTLALNNATHNKTYHLVSEQLFALNQFYQFAKEFGYDVELLPYAQWRKKLLDSQAENKSDNALFPVSTLFTEDYYSNWRNPKYDRTQISNALQFTGIKCTRAESVLPVYFSYFVRSGFLPEPANKSTSLYTKWVTEHKGSTVEIISRSNRTR